VTTSVVQVTVDNTPPAIKLIYPPSNEEYFFGKDEWVSLNPDVSDNIAIDRIEFFLDNDEKPFLVRATPPYDVKWKLDNPDKIGGHTFYARAYDKAGNMTESNKVKVVVQPKPKSP
jgi:hypothetical protein